MPAWHAAPIEAMQSTRTAARGVAGRDFRLLLSAQAISLLGSGVTTVGLALFAYRLTGGASATLVIGHALMLRILAFLLFSQPAGVLADRVDRKRMLIIADLIRFGLLMLFPFITTTWQIYLLVFVVNAATAFFTPVFEASIPSVVGDADYVKALSWSRVASDMEVVAGPALAALLVALVGLRWVFWFDAASYVLSALLVGLVTIPRAAEAAKALSPREFFVDITYGTRVLLRDSALRQALLLSLAEAIAGAAAIVGTVSYVRDVLHHGETAVALVMAAVGAGSATTAFVLGRVTARRERSSVTPAALHSQRHRWTRIALLGGGAALFCALVPGVLLPATSLFVGLWVANGCGQASIGIASSTLLAEHTTESDRGRTYAAHFAWSHSYWLLTYPAIGYAVAWWGAPRTFLYAGLACGLVTGVAGFVSPRPVADAMHS
ncbi:MAG: MFS transporter [Polyangia bacterium]